MLKDFINLPSFKKDKEKSKGSLIVSYIIGGIVAVLVIVLFATGSVSYSVNDTSIKLKGTLWKSATIEYSDIVEVEYRDHLDKGTRSWGIETSKMDVGKFQNSEFGTYGLYSYAKAPSFLIIKTADYNYALGLLDDQVTKELYSSLKSKVH